MDVGSFFGQSAAVQAGLGFGYLAYATAYAGLRDKHQAQDAVFITLAFGVPAALTFHAMAAFGWAPALLGALAVALGLAVLWRFRARELWRRLMRMARVHTDDGASSAWAGLIQTTRPFSQVAVHLKDGRVLHSLDLRRHQRAHLGGLLLGSDGGVVMVVEIEDAPGTDRHEVADASDDYGRTRLTYLPPDQIARVDLRIG